VDLSARAVFLSYASEDAATATCIADALKAAGIEVWFDQSELRGGDAWDRQIRRHIHDCSLFLPIISAHTEERLEGYFRREWKLAADRTHDMAEEKAFLVPIVIDEVSERQARVPDKFRDVQWTRLPAGEISTAFIERIKRLLSPDDLPVARSRTRASASVNSGALRSRGHRTGLVYAALAAAAMVLAGGYFELQRPHGLGSHAAGKASIAVLPLANESGDPSQQYFSDGISEDLITALSQFSGLKVIGRSSSSQFRDSKEDARSIGMKLGVAHLLEGSVRKSGDLIRVSAELIDTADGSTQWSARYDRPYKDVFALQDEITRAVTGALRTRLVSGEHAAGQGDRPPSGSLEAYNALMEGQFYALRETEAYYRKAIDSYSRATELDPQYALAWSRLSRSWGRLGLNYLDGTPQKAALEKAREAADRALEISPELAAAHIAQGYLLKYVDLDWRGAEEAFRRALSLAPNDAEAMWFVGGQLATRGDLNAAIELSKKALETDPRRSVWYKWLGLYYAGLNRFDLAAEAIRMAVALEPGAGASEYADEVALIAVLQGDAHAALAAARQAYPDDPLALALARQIGGDRGAADGALKALIDARGNDMAYFIAQVYGLRNEVDKAFEWLDRAWSNRDSGIDRLLFDPLLLRFKNDPRFAAYCRKVGLPVPGESLTQGSIN
jgi:TolB-like protein/Flp pilus assembly protein TadD